MGMQHGFPAFPGESPGACPTWVLLPGALQCLPAAKVSTGIAGEEPEPPRRELLGNSCHALHSQPIYFAITSP